PAASALGGGDAVGVESVRDRRQAAAGGAFASDSLERVGGDICGGRPSRTPCARAAASAALVRSESERRAQGAKLASTVVLACAGPRPPPAAPAGGRRGARAGARCSPERAPARRAGSRSAPDPAHLCSSHTANTLSYKAWPALASLLPAARALSPGR